MQKANISLRSVDVNNTEDLLFMAELLKACADQFIDDDTPSLMQMICVYEGRIKRGEMICFVCLHKGQPAGAIWADVEGRYGTIGAALLPEKRLPKLAYLYLKLFIDVAFQELGLYKLEARISTNNRTAERLCRKMGMKKEGLLRKRQRKAGRFADLVLLGLLKQEWSQLNGA